jgi:C-terminal processing protease CtpA/Prc
VLANGGSFSTTCEFLSHVRDLGRATFVGEETGGAYVGNTSGGAANLVLPHSGLRVHIPILRYDLAVKPAQPFGRGIMPDVPVTYSIAELIAGDDKQLARALALARGATN